MLLNAHKVGWPTAVTPRPFCCSHCHDPAFSLAFLSPPPLTLLPPFPQFHSGLMACCLEIVVAAYKMASFGFPHSIDRLKLKPFDFSKVIQSFVKYLPSLPR